MPNARRRVRHPSKSPLVAIQTDDAHTYVLMETFHISKHVLM